MCTLIVRFDPDADWPVLIASTRDEFRTRAWDRPAEWWPDRHPGVLGGRDREAGGTWLAVDAAERRAATVLNRNEPTALSAAGARSRGELPLAAASGGSAAIASLDVATTRPFNLAVAGPEAVIWWRYDGEALSRHEVGPGLHILTAADLDEMSNPRQRHWLPIFERAAPPAPAPDNGAGDGWGEWPQLLADLDRPYDDPRALNVRYGGANGAFGTVSASLLAISERTLRFDFCPASPDRGEWIRVL